MSTFTLDTSGLAFANRPDGSCHLDAWAWEHLTPFTQGYVEALFASLRRHDIGHWDDASAKKVLRFDELAPEALAMILGDCERFRAYGERERFECIDNTAAHGGRFWVMRHTRPWPAHPPVYARDGFPPLTPYLGDDGKIYLRTA